MRMSKIGIEDALKRAEMTFVIFFIKKSLRMGISLGDVVY